VTDVVNKECEISTPSLNVDLSNSPCHASYLISENMYMSDTYMYTFICVAIIGTVPFII